MTLVEVKVKYFGNHQKKNHFLKICPKMLTDVIAIKGVTTTYREIEGGGGNIFVCFNVAMVLYLIIFMFCIYLKLID